jgi:general secretion pathway protein G
MISTLKKLQAKKAAQENNGGFTLIELLIVIVVLGILAAVVVFSLGNVTGKSAIAACQADGATVETAIAAYNAQNTSGTPTAANLVSGGYLVSFPNNASHYLFGINGGVLYESIGTNTVPLTVTSGTASAGWTAWSGASTCSSTTVS